MTAITANQLSKTYPLVNGSKRVHDALSDVSFQIEEGESVGIIGRNGAGKSTLLKLLSGIAFPTSGEAKIEGTFSSLLEVGTGFHPDLSGRDNIFLNASILGISKAAVTEQLDQIISFSGVEEYINQPLRSYSSGMKLRLAFAVIAYLKTDIIALDEVLAVGDSMFQVKCMDRIFDFKNEGRTILFVSHNLSAVKKLCNRSLVIENGKIVFDGLTGEAISFYTRLNSSTAEQFKSSILKQLKITTEEKEGKINIALQNLNSDLPLDLGVNITNQDGLNLYHLSNRFIDFELKPQSGNLDISISFQHSLKPGFYPISIYVGQEEKQIAWIEGVAKLEVPPFNPHGFHNPDALQGPVIGKFSIEQH
ncbi:ABC transporter ATP-binding protein [Flavobacteriales bacterium]|nr:ABC transporter ATP-binding protein [Flavobacteriales bacterium]